MACGIIKASVVCRIFCICECHLAHYERLWCSWSRRGGNLLRWIYLVSRTRPQFWTCGFEPFLSAKDDLPSLGNLPSRVSRRWGGRYYCRREGIRVARRSLIFIHNYQKLQMPRAIGWLGAMFALSDTFARRADEMPVLTLVLLLVQHEGIKIKESRGPQHICKKKMNDVRWKCVKHFRPALTGCDSRAGDTGRQLQSAAQS